jgi:hypothetical protein
MHATEQAFSRLKSYIFPALLTAMLITGCAEDSTDPVAPPQTTQNPGEQTPQDVKTAASLTDTIQTNPALSAFIETIDNHYVNLQAKADELHSAIIKFARSPSETTLDNAISAWEHTHDIYLAGRHLDTLFTDLVAPENQQQTGPGIHTRLDSQPLLPGYLDAVSGYPFSGLIHSDIPLTLVNMYQEFQLGDTAYITLGFHALEVMLKGTDKERDSAEFAPLKSTKDTSEAPPELRRTLYSILLAEQIRLDVLQLPAIWRQQIKNALGHLDQEQTRQLNAVLQKNLRQRLQSLESTTSTRPDDTSVHAGETANAIERELLQKLLTDLEDPPP